MADAGARATSRVRAIHRMIRLTSEILQAKRGVGVPPRALELLAHEGRLVGPLLSGECRHQPEEGAAAAAVPLEIGAKDALGVSGPSLAQEGATQGLAGGKVPGGRLVVGHAVLDLYGLTGDVRSLVLRPRG